MKFSLVFFLSVLLFSTHAMDLSSLDMLTGPGERLVEFIEGLAHKVVEEENNHYSVFKAQSEQCEKELLYRKAEVDDAQSSLSAAQAHLQRCESALQQAENDLAGLNSQRTVVLGLLESAKDERNRQREVFEKEEAEHKAALTAIQEAFDIIRQFKNANAAGVAFFAQMGKHITTRVKASIGSKFFKFYAPVIAFLAQSPKDVAISEQDLVKLKQLFNNLEVSLSESLKNLVEIENKRIEDYELIKQNLNNQLTEIDEAVKKFEEYIWSMKRCQTTEGTVISQATSKLSRNSGILENTTQMCQAFAKEYHDAHEARERKGENLRLLRELIETKVADYEAGSNYAGEFRT